MFRVWCLGFRFRVWGLGFRVQGLGFSVWGLDMRTRNDKTLANINHLDAIWAFLLLALKPRWLFESSISTGLLDPGIHTLNPKP